MVGRGARSDRFAALVFVAWVWGSIAGADAGETGRRARAEDASRAAAEAVLLGAGAASLIAVGFTLAQASHTQAPDRGMLTALALASVALAWSAVHTVYALRYARLYYTPPDGGIDFKGDRPDYLDFAYLALTIGMTFQVSDTDLARQPRPSASAASRADLVRVRDRHRRDHGQLGRFAARPVAVTGTPQPLCASRINRSATCSSHARCSIGCGRSSCAALIRLVIVCS